MPKKPRKPRKSGTPRTPRTPRSSRTPGSPSTLAAVRAPVPVDTSMIPLAEKIQDSWAWHPESVDLGENFYQIHRDDGGTASHRDLIRLANWLFAQDGAGEVPNVQAFQQALYQFDPEDPAGAATMNTFLTQNIGTNAPRLSHAQWVQLLHVLIRQVDVKLVSPRDLRTLAW